VEKDYLIRRTDLAALVRGALRSHAAYLITHKISVQTEDLAHTVFTDPKWVTFILRQLMDNSVKYGCKKLEFFGVENENSVSLFLRDDGDGIPKQDVERVFEKGFTGENGRRYGHSTGLGLYLCRKLCLRLGLRIALTADAGQGVTVEIVFPGGAFE
jgi:signal transduction histidine kinase